MAYKFQVGAARLSGSTVFEQSLSTLQSFGAKTLSSSAGLQVGGTVELDGVVDVTAAPASDSFYILDADDGLMKRESMSAYATTIAGDGLAASSGVLSVGVDDSTVELDSDGVRVKATGITEAHLNTSVAGVGISGGGGSALALDLNELVAEQIASGDFLAFVDSTDNGTHKETVDDLATLFAGTGLAASSAVLSVDLNELSAADIDVANDSFALIDANDSNGSKKESIADLMTAVAGNGLAASSGVLSLDVSEVADAAVASGDKFVFEDSDNSTKKESIDDIATLFAGSGLTASSAVLSVQLSGALGLSSGGSHLGITGSFAGDGLKFLGGQKSISSIELDVNELPAGTVANGDFFAFVDADDNSTKKEAVADLATLFAGTGLAAAASQMSVDLNELSAADINVAADSIAIIDADDSNASKKESIADLMTAVAGDGLAASSGVLAVGVDDSSIETSGDALRVKALGVTNAMLAGSIADSKLNQITTGDKVAGSSVQLAGTSALEDSTGLRLKAATAGDGLAISSQVLSVDLNELSAATVDVANDSIAIIDANDSNGSKKESISDLVGAMAGAGLAAASGVLRVPSSEVSIQDYRSNFNAAVGVNAPDTNAMGSAITVTMPDPLAVAGAKVIIKAPASCTSSNTVTISGATIDGQSSIVLEGPGAAVTLINVDVGGDSWIIV